MTAILLVLALFGAWCLVGAAVLAAVRADLTSLRVALTAPAVGTAATVLPLFVLSDFGVAMKDGAPPVALTLLIGSIAIVAIRRPAVTAAAAPVLAVAVAGLLLAGWPLFDFGFRWIANANDDMANYVLSATQTLHAGLLARPDIVGLSHNHSYASLLETLNAAGARPGAAIALGALAGVTGRPTYELFMPLILALQLCMICGTAALAMQASTRRWVAVVAAGLAAIAPLSTFGILQQLLPQVWGLGLAAALLALLMRRELHRGAGATLRDAIPIALLVAALIVVYVELASTIALAYVLYLVLLASKRELSLRAAARIWVPCVVFAVAVLNAYALRELRWVRAQAALGVHGVAHGLFAGAPAFGFTLVPGALPGIIGLQEMPIPGGALHVNSSIAASLFLLTGVLVASLWSALRGVAASLVLVTYAAIGAYLGLKSSDFGLYKLYMYVQPFLAASVAVWLAAATRRRVLAVIALPLALIVVAQVRTQQEYVRESRDPGGLRDASTPNLIPAFRRFAADDPKPIVSVTENPTLGKLEAIGAGQQPVDFISQNLFAAFTAPRVARANGWRPRSFVFIQDGKRHADAFLENTHASAALSIGACTIVLPTGRQSVLNRRSLPEDSLDLVARPCGDARNTLVFIASKLGWGFYDFYDRRKVGLYPVQSDIFFPGRTMSSFGSDVLFRVLRPSPRVRLELDLTTTYIHDGSNLLPPASVIGARRARLPLIGRGSARVFSGPLSVKVIAGQPYVLLDMGRSGKLQPDFRPGLSSLWGRSVPLDPRYVTAYVRDVSLVSESQYRRLRPPAVLSSFPKGLGSPDLEYSGIYEDGWVGEDSYVVLAGGGAADLVMRAEVPTVPGGQRLRVLVNGREVATRAVAPGQLSVHVPVPPSHSPRRIDLRWASAPRLPEPDGRPAAAFLQFLGFVPKTSH